MSAYHQMGHDSWNLVGEGSLQKFKGIILSPVNDSPAAMTQKLQQLRKSCESLEIILDPQFYEPRTARGQLGTWPYFSEDVDTVNLGDQQWWRERINSLVSIATDIGANAICSPAIMPRVHDDNYYSWVVECANSAHEQASQANLDVLLTALVRLPELAKAGRPQTIATILTTTKISRVYLVFSDDLTPRTQRTDVEGLAGAICLIKLLEEAGTKVLVAFTGLDMLLWKAAGASDVASGKFFNLRRFVPGRFEDDGQDGGRTVPYLTDGRLITWLREDDVKHLDRNNLIDREEISSNPYSQKIFEILDAGAGAPWIGYAWRQYLYWFQETEAAISGNVNVIKALLRNSDSLWGTIDSSEIYMYDRQNTGAWIRSWLNAIQIGLKND